MAITMSHALDALDARMAAVTSQRPPIPSTRSVPSLETALRDIQRLGGTVTSETRTAPGIGSWAFVADVAGAELVIWQDASAIGS